MASKEKNDSGGQGQVFEESPLERRLIVLGKTGNGKSTVGNLLLGQKHFQVGFSMTSTTVTAAVGSADVLGWKIKVLDTPDISNLLDNVDEDRGQREVASWKALTSPQAHAILLAVRCDVRYTREEHQIYLQLKKLWGGHSLCRRLIVAFTFGDRQDRPLEEDLRHVCPELKQVLKDASHRYVLFNDLDDPHNKQEQVLNLLHMVDRLDAEALKMEERRLLGQVQICPPGPVPPPPHPLVQRSSSSGSTSSRGSVDIECIKLVLVGRPGTGKSSTGNTILGSSAFPVHHTNNGTIHTSAMEEADIDGKILQVVDTPGLQEDTGSKDYHQARQRASQLLRPAPHALLYVVRHQQVTQKDLEAFRTLKQDLGQGLSHHTIVVLVGASWARSSGPPPPPSPPPHDLEQAPPVEVEEEEEGEVFPVLLREAGGKWWMVDNELKVGAKDWQRQLSDLMSLLRGILNNSGGDCFHWEQARDSDTAGRGKERSYLKEFSRNSCSLL